MQHVSTDREDSAYVGMDLPADRGASPVITAHWNVAQSRGAPRMSHALQFTQRRHLFHPVVCREPLVASMPTGITIAAEFMHSF